MKPSDKIWLEPECDECDERCWSCAPFDDCEECGKETIGYVRDDIVLAASQEASRMFDRIEKLEAALRLYACDCKPDDGCGVEYYDGGANCGRTARKALEGKDD